MEIEKNKVFHPHKIVRGKVLEARVLGSISTIRSGFEGHYEVDLLCEKGEKRTFHLYGKLPSMGTEQAYSTEFECVHEKNVKY